MQINAVETDAVSADDKMCHLKGGAVEEKLESGVRLKAAVGEGESQTTLSLTMSEEGGQEDRRRHFLALGFIACGSQPVSVRHNTSDSCELLQEKLVDKASLLFGAD